MTSSAQLDETKRLLAKLVSFDTTSRNSNLALIHFVRDYLEDIGVESELVHDEDGGKANLFATLGPEGDGGLAAALGSILLALVLLFYWLYDRIVGIDNVKLGG